MQCNQTKHNSLSLYNPDHPAECIYHPHELAKERKMPVPDHSSDDAERSWPVRLFRYTESLGWQKLVGGDGFGGTVIQASPRKDWYVQGKADTDDSTSFGASISRL